MKNVATTESTVMVSKASKRNHKMPVTAPHIHAAAQQRHPAQSRVTRREQFLQEMEQLVPWQRLVTLIESRYTHAGPVPRDVSAPHRTGENPTPTAWSRLSSLMRKPRQPLALRGNVPHLTVERMLRLHFLQIWFNLSDEALSKALKDRAAFRTFADVASDLTLDPAAMQRFRDLLEQHALGQFLIEQVNIELNRHHLLMCEGAWSEASIISFAPEQPSSTSPEQIYGSGAGRPFSKQSKPQTLIRDNARLLWPMLAPLAAS